MTESPSDADIIADGRVFALNCEYAHGRCTRLDFSPGNLVAFARALLAAKQPEPPSTVNVIFPCAIHDWTLMGVGSTTGQQSWQCKRCGIRELRWSGYAAPPPTGPMREPVAPAKPTLPDAALCCIQAYGDARADDDGTSAARLKEAIIELRNWGAALAAQPSPEGGEAEREALTLALRALEDAGSMWMKSGDVGRRLAAIDAIHAALSRKETPHASD